MNDATHDPKCCEIRQFISWNTPDPPHQGFPPTSKPNTWYEDRDKDDKRYGRHKGPQSSAGEGDQYGTDSYKGWDRPNGFAPGDVLSFRLTLVDVCNGEKTIYTSKTIKDQW